MICMNHIVELCLLAKPAGDGLLHFADDSVITGLSDMWQKQLQNEMI